MIHPAQSGRKTGFTLVELLVTITIIATLASQIFLMASKGVDSARTSKSVSNLHQLYTGIGSWAAENNMRFPINYKSNAFGGASKPKEEIAAVWYEAAGRNIYLDLYQKTSSAGIPWMWASKYSNGYEDTAFRSPNAEKGYSKTIASYGYNTNFQRVDDTTSKTTVISVDPSQFNAARTCLIADNSGKTHSLGPEGDNGNASINARNGASGAFKRDGKAVVVFLDGHVETISAQRARELNNKKDDPFWGVEP
jgi:prepilin-type N-terminal cleavage/methylation domain-containing protein/prepilin-type processing-associated H-X9-DG protein